MSQSFVLAFLGIVIGLPVVLGIGGSAFKHWLDYKREIAAHGRGDAGRAAAHTARLEQRVAVLERILTDRSATLGDEIERCAPNPSTEHRNRDFCRD